MLKKKLGAIIALVMTFVVAVPTFAAFPASGQIPLPLATPNATYCASNGLLYYTLPYESLWYWAGGVETCSNASPSSIRGTAYEDLNGNGKRDANEPEMGGAWYKVSDGGGWFVCGWVGWDATYAVPVSQPGTTYVVDAIAPVGWKTTTPRVKVVTFNAAGGAYLYNDLGFVRDPSVKTVEGCDQYHPVRR